MDNFTRLPNAVLDTLLLQDLSSLEWTVVMYIARKTYGWGKQTDTISVRKMATDTGHDLRAMQRTVTKLREKNILNVGPRGSRGMQTLGINDPAMWGKKATPTVTQPYTVTQPAVTQPRVYGQATAGSDGQATVGSYGQVTTHKRNKETKDTIQKKDAPPAPEGANVAADAADANASAADTANANANASDWTPSELPDDVWADASLWK